VKKVLAYALAAADPLAHFGYSPFGQTLDASGALVGIFPFGFSSKYLDSEVGLYYYGYRHYAPRLGRWLNRDPIEEQGGLNLYAFVGNGPMGEWDYLGLKKCLLCCAPNPPAAAGCSKISDNGKTRTTTCFGADTCGGGFGCSAGPSVTCSYSCTMNWKCSFLKGMKWRKVWWWSKCTTCPPCW
jgi:RHS repeat-associated protein